MSAGDSNSPVFDFTNLDYESVLEDLERYAQTVFSTEEWTDFNVNQFGSKLLRLKAYCTDLVAYNANSWVLETLISELVSEQSLRTILKSEDYRPSSKSPSVTTLQFTIDPAFTPMNLPATFQVGSSLDTTAIFEPDVEVAIPALATSVTVSASAGSTATDALGISDGSKTQRFTLASLSMIDGTLSITVGAEAYTEVDNWVDAGPLDKVFMTFTDADEATEVIFGDGTNGLIPPTGEAITAVYKFGGGDSSNFAIGEIDTMVSTLAGVLAVTNTTAAEGGGPKQSVESIKRNLPASRLSNYRIVNPADAAAKAIELVGQVLKAKGVAGKYQAGGSPIELYVLPNGGGDPSDLLAAQIIAELADLLLAGKRLYIRSPLFVRLKMVVDVNVQRTARALPTERKVRDTLLAKYALDADATDFGALLELQDAYRSLPQGSSTVRSVSFKKFTVEPYASRYLYSPTTGDGDAEYITINEESVQRREWFIQVSSLSPVPQFTVKQRRLGIITEISDTTLTDEKASFTASELIGASLLVRPRDNLSTLTITANTPQTISVAGGLLQLATGKDPYVVQTTEANVGKIFRTTVVSMVADTANVYVASATQFTAGDSALIRNGDVAFLGVVQTVTGTAATIMGTVDLTTLVYGVGGSLDGEAITLEIHGTPYTVLFTAPADAAAVVAAVQAVVGAVATASLSSNRLVITTLLADGSASIEIVSGTVVIGSNVLVDLGFTAAQTATGTSLLVFTEAISVAFPLDATVDWYWTADDGTVGFALVQGATTNFVIGDQLFVDTYEEAGDIQLRDEAYPLFEEDDLTTTPIGGIR